MEKFKNWWYSLSNSTRVNIEFFGFIGLITFIFSSLFLFPIAVICLFSLILLCIVGMLVYMLYTAIKDNAEESKRRFLDKKAYEEWCKKRSYGGKKYD